MNSITIEKDLAQRKLALDASQSFIVQAPAGSGKTELLIQRFLTLLQYVNKPEEILSITFTKKAANEMRARLIKALKRAHESEPESAHAKLTWQLANRVLQRDAELNWELLTNPNQLRIQTIDSLCAFLTRQLPILSHLGSQPELADQPEYYYEEAVREVLRHIEETHPWSDAIAALLIHLDNDMNKLHNLLVQLLAKRDQWLPYIIFDQNEDDIRVKLEDDLQAIISECLSNVIELFPLSLSNQVCGIARFAAENLRQRDIDGDNAILACCDMTDLPDTDDKEAWIGIANILLTKSFSWRKRPDAAMGFPALTELTNKEEKATHQHYRSELKELITALEEHESLRLALIDVMHLPEPHYSDEQWQILKSLFQVLKVVSAQLRVVFQQHGKIDFIENAQAALQALNHHDTPTDLALALDYQIQHILIDEFQDTAFTQYQLLERLTAGWQAHDSRTLFVVGDPMQSIYRFREAEVGLFIRMRKQGLRHFPLTPLTLAINFRSSPTIVDWNNTHFRKIFPQQNDIASGAVTYSSSISNQDKTNQSSAITTYCHLGAEDQQLAQHTIEIIKQTQQSHPDENIAILVRSRSHLTSIIPALKKSAIPYHAVDIDPLVSRQVIQDLLALTCALLHPGDRISWLAILRAPWCGLSLADLLILAGPYPHSTLWQQLQNKNAVATLSTDGQERLARVLPVLRSKISDRDRYDLRTWIESSWILLGGPACLLDENEKEEAATYFSLLQETEDLNLDKLKNKIKILYATSKHNHAKLQIMTIHTAKGLEFDTVILPHLEKKTPNMDKPLLSWMEQPLNNDEAALLLAPIHATGTDVDTLYQYINRQQRIKANYETDRLLYVATTRAKNRLFLLFKADKNADGEIKGDSGSFLEKLAPVIQNEMIVIENTALDEINQTNDNRTRTINRITTNWVNPIKEVTNNATALHYQQSGFLLRDNTPQLIGTVTHRILQTLSQQSDWWSSNDESKKIVFISNQLTQLGIAKHHIHEATNHVVRLINNTVADQRGQWILKNHLQAYSEYAISTSVNETVERHVIDRTFIDENGVRWIIDYKTSTLNQQEVDEFLESEQDKYLKKMDAYANALKLMSSHPVKLGLYFPAIPAWIEWER